ncbi:MAG TPA: matrixin family metalloprotease [Polyangiales bacterium]
MQEDRKWASYALGVLVGALSPYTAHAYCRSTTEPTGGTCPAPCVSTGIPLAWGTPEIEYALHRDAFTGPDGAAFQAAIARSFSHWAEVSCSGHAVGFTFSVLPQRTELTVGPVASEPNLNVISELDAAQWDALGFDSHAFAKTQLWFETKTGEIVGADIAFNRTIGNFAVCPDAGCAPDTIDLENVATHEIGHFLGLAHSDDRASTMWCDAVKGDLQKRSLADDDVAGLCAMYGSQSGFIDPGPKTNGDAPGKSDPGGCALASAEPPHASSAFGTLSLLALLLRRRKARLG